VVWSLLFFLMLISLALGSIFAAFETILAALSDQWPILRCESIKEIAAKEKKRKCRL
jgi:hypothetical protein